jgi:hypothetical protein
MEGAEWCGRVQVRAREGIDLEWRVRAAKVSTRPDGSDAVLEAGGWSQVKPPLKPSFKMQ